jgi:hypothetical protein
MSAQQRRIRDLVAIAIFVALLLVLFWPAGDDDDSGDAAPDGVAETGTPTPEPTALPANQRELACEPADAFRVLNAWVGAFNTGDSETLAEMLPEEGAETPVASSYPGMDQAILHSFTIHESGTMSAPEDVLDYLVSRQSEHNERWRVDDVHVQRLERAAESGATELDRATVAFQRTADDIPEHVVSGDIVLNCDLMQVLMVDLFSDDAELALPIPFDEFLSAVGPYGTGEMRDLRMMVSTDLREDFGALSQWDIRRIEANSMSGSYVETVRVMTPGGNELLHYVYDGAQWFLRYRNWQEVGDLTGWAVLPLEIMMTRLEPSITADLLREHLEEIPVEGTTTLTGEFEVREELRRAAEATTPLFETVDGVIEVEIQDGNLIRTNYRLLDRQTGTHFSAPEIEWLHIHRRDRYDTSLFSRPAGFSPDAQQFQPPDDLQDAMTLIERRDHLDGIGEHFELDWNGVNARLLVMPSRGRTQESAWGDDWPLTWNSERTEFGAATIITAGPEGQNFPTVGLWDTGRFRFELTVDPETLSNPEQWNSSEVLEIARALLVAEDSGQGGWRTTGPP